MRPHEDDANQATPSLVRKELIQTIAQLNDEITEKGVQVLFDIDAAAERHQVKLVWPRLSNILLNIVSNAVNFSPIDSTVRIRVSLRTREEQSAKIFISVMDEGIGLSNHDLDLLFLPYGLARDIPDDFRHLQGNGLSLFHSKRLCEEAGGGMTVDTKPGLGSIFLFWLEAEILSNPDRLEQKLRNLEEENSSVTDVKVNFEEEQSIDSYEDKRGFHTFTEAVQKKATGFTEGLVKTYK